ncbi:MAG: hypothetical protein AABY22_36230 [Nanoarchaeota archaeon]
MKTNNKEIEKLIDYAVQEGFIGEEAYDWTDEQKESYYNKCQSVDSNDFSDEPY